MHNPLPPVSHSPRISPSLLAMDPGHLAQEVIRLTQAQADILHIDVMDGHFVQALTWGPAVIQALRPRTFLPFDVHLMVQDPDVDAYIDAGADWITIHPAACQKIRVGQTLEHLKARGIKPGLAICLDEDPLLWQESWWRLAEIALVMAVTPGKGGQPFQPKACATLETLRQHYPHLTLSIDGGITPVSAAQVWPRADILVAGSFVVSQGHTSQAYAQTLSQLRQARPPREI